MLPVPICNNEEGCLFLFLTLPLNIKMPFAVVADRNVHLVKASPPRLLFASRCYPSVRKLGTIYRHLLSLQG